MSQTFTLRDAAVLSRSGSESLCENQREEAASCSKSERQAAKSVHTGWSCLCVWQNVKACRLRASELHLLHSKPSYTKFGLATRKFQKMKAFTRLEIEIWCMDLGYVKIAEDDRGVMCLLVLQDLFATTVGSIGMETKDSKETSSIFEYDYKK